MFQIISHAATIGFNFEGQKGIFPSNYVCLVTVVILPWLRDYQYRLKSCSELEWWNMLPCITGLNVDRMHESWSS